MRRLRRYLLEGLALLAPIGATVWVLLWLFRRLDGILAPWIQRVAGQPVPGLGIIALALLLITIGWLTERTLGRRMTRLWDATVERVPLVRSLYRGSRRIVESVVGQESRAFKEAVLFEYPSPGTWAVGFVTGQAPPATLEHVQGPAVTIFLPTAPNPMSGFLLVIPRSRLYPLNVPPDEALTYVLSMGAVPLGQSRAAPVASTEDAVRRGP